MKLIFGLAMLWSSITLSRFQCVLEKEYFCSSIPNGFPEGLTSLLFVVTNLGVINATVFNSPSLKSVTSLALANSGITRIEPGALHAFQNLTKLSLYQNSLANVTSSWLLNPGRLENLTLAQNLIAEIRSNMFVGFSNLSTLNLANNRIRRIDSGSFKDLTKLTFVDLSGNNLTTLTRKIFSGLVVPPTVKLGGNPWNCSCDLQDFGLYLQELKNASQLEDTESVLCHSPSSLEGIPVWNISDLNCSLDFPSSAFENGFHKVGLPALLACLAFISFVLLLIFIWITKQDRQVRPSKEATGLTTNAQPPGHISSMTEPGQSDDKVRVMETGTSSWNRMPKVRPKSAMAILLRTEFYQGRQQSVTFAGANQEHLIPPSVATKDQSFIGSEDFCNFMKLWYYHKLKECRGKDVPSSFLTDVQMETSEIKLPSEGEKQMLPDIGNSGAVEKEEEDKGRDSVENPEPFLYLSIATAAEEAIDEDPQKDVITKASGSHLASLKAKVPLKRSLTWPYERSLVGHKSNTLSVRESFVMQFFLHALAPGESVGAGKSERYEKQPKECSRKEHRGCGSGTPDVNKEARLDIETEPPCKREAGESMGVGKSEFDGLERQHEMHECPRKDDLVYGGSVELKTEGKVTRKDDLVYGGSVELKTEGKVTNQQGLPFQQESKTADTRCAHTWQSRIKASQHPVVLKNKQSLKPESSRSRARQEIQPSLPPSDHVSPTGSQQEDAIVENHECNYINLLYEVVENRGRWTRERWKQTHRTGVLNDRPAKFK